MTTPAELAQSALERVTKWRLLFAGWQLGTRPKGEPECDAVRDHRELSILLRVECSAIARVLLEKGIVTADEWNTIVAEEAARLDAAYEQRFPGVRAVDDGIIMDPVVVEQKGTMAGWRP